MASALQDSGLGNIISLGGGFFVFFGIILLLFGVLTFFIGLGLWKGQNWARIVSIIFGCTNILTGAYSVVLGNYSAVIGFLLNLIIVVYLLLNKDVKSAFA
jgi:uncharacterized membrane protein (DUF2068 family)